MVLMMFKFIWKHPTNLCSFKDGIFHLWQFQAQTVGDRLQNVNMAII